MAQLEEELKVRPGLYVRVSVLDPKIEQDKEIDCYLALIVAENGEGPLSTSDLTVLHQSDQIYPELLGKKVGEKIFLGEVGKQRRFRITEILLSPPEKV